MDYNEATKKLKKEQMKIKILSHIQEDLEECKVRNISQDEYINEVIEMMREVIK